MSTSPEGVESLVPDPVASDEQHARYYHGDVELLEDFEIVVELRRIEVALTTSHRVRHVVERGWLLARHGRLRAALHSRGAT